MSLEEIKNLLTAGKTDQAIFRLEKYIEYEEASYEAYLMLGNAYRKKDELSSAINAYLKAMEIRPEGEAKQAYEQTVEILDFYYKDMYNQ